MLQMIKKLLVSAYQAQKLKAHNKRLDQKLKEIRHMFD